MTNDSARISVGEIFAGTARLVQRHPRPLAIYALGLAAVTVAAQAATAGDHGESPGLIVSMFAGFLLTEVLLRGEGQLGDGIRRRRFFAYIGASLLAVLGMMAGAVFFIIPGLILLARWSLASVLVVAEERGPLEALGESWEATRASQWTILGAYLAFFAIVIVGLALVGGATYVTSGPDFGGTEFGTRAPNPLHMGLLANLANYGTEVLSELAGGIGNVMSVAIFIALRPSSASLQSVFE